MTVARVGMAVTREPDVSPCESGDRSRALVTGVVWAGAGLRAPVAIVLARGVVTRVSRDLELGSVGRRGGETGAVVTAGPMPYNLLRKSKEQL